MNYSILIDTLFLLFFTILFIGSVYCMLPGLVFFSTYVVLTIDSERKSDEIGYKKRPVKEMFFDLLHWRPRLVFH